MASNQSLLDAFNVVVENTKAIEQAVINGNQAVVTQLHAIVQLGTQQQATQAAGYINQAGGNPLAGLTQAPPDHVPGSGAAAGSTGAVPASQGGPSTGYAQPAPQHQAAATGQNAPGGGGGQGGGTGGGGGGGGRRDPYTNGYGYGPNRDQPPSRLFDHIRESIRGGPGAPPVGRGGTAMGLLGLGQDAYRMFMSANEDASRYQGMTGGSTRWEGAQTLAREKLYATTTRLRDFNGLSGEEAAQAFANTRAMGYRTEGEQGRGNLTEGQVLNFYQRNKTNMGMSAAESDAVMNQVLANGAVDSAEGLRQVSEALHQVSEAAGAAGVNALLARQNFLGMFQGLTNAGAGTGATAIAAATTASLARGGTSMMNIDQGVQYEGDWQYRAASAGNMSVGQFQVMLRNNPQQAMGIVDQMNAQSAEDIIGSDQANWIRQRADSMYGGKAALTGDAGHELIQALADDWHDQFGGEMDTQAMADQIKSMMGVTLTQDQVPKWIVMQVMGINPSDIASGAANRDGGSGSSVMVGENMSSATGANGGAANSRSIAMLAPTGSGNTGQEASGPNGKRLNAAQEAYRSLSQSRSKGGKAYRNPIIERLMESVDDPENTEVLITHESGSRMATLAEAIEHYPESIAAGKVAIVGKNGMQSVAEAAGISEEDLDENVDTLHEIQQRDEGATVGREISEDERKEWQALQEERAKKQEGDAAAASGSGTLKIEATPALEKMFNFNYSRGQGGTDGGRPDPSQATDPGARSTRAQDFPYVPNYASGGGQP